MEEFRMIDYRQRLVSNQRNTFEGDAATYMVNEETESGRKAMGLKTENHFEIGQAIDSVIYNSNTHLLANTSERNRLSTIVFTSDSSRIMGTIINGRWVVKDQHNHTGHAIKVAFSKALQELRNR
jgi:formimidoylglutamate deiminase